MIIMNPTCHFVHYLTQCLIIYIYIVKLMYRYDNKTYILITILFFDIKLLHCYIF